MMENNFQGTCKMIPVCYHNPGVVLIYINTNFLSGCNRINLCTIHNDTNPEQAQQNILLTCNDNMIFSCNKTYLSELMI